MHQRRRGTHRTFASELQADLGKFSHWQMRRKITFPYSTCSHLLAHAGLDELKPFKAPTNLFVPPSITIFLFVLISADSL